VAVLLLAAGTAACGGGDGRPPPATARTSAAVSPASTTQAGAPVPACLDSGEAQPVAAADAAGRSIPAWVLGTGDRVAVLANESDDRPCRWVTFARHLAGRGYRSVLFSYEGKATAIEAADRVGRIVARMRDQGARRVVLVGASLGAFAVIVAAVDVRPPVDGTVALSPPPRFSGTDLAGYAARTAGPLLLATATEDRVDAAAATAEFARLAPPGTTRRIEVPGVSHGITLLSGDGATVVAPAVDAFIDEHAR
jgi:pimeloyl-ACP methyl ester carboxylesterase